ncbi:MAG: cysteine rich repeat-containing protein [Proteobacteria bacterium]|nr:cysteine rich repeat-containing protein [Pseudomonadota bacterium]
MKAALIALGCLTFALAVHADDGPPNARKACKADYQKFCSGVPRGGGKILDCLNSHKSEISPACQQAIASKAPKDGGAPAADPAPKAQ